MPKSPDTRTGATPDTGTGGTSDRPPGTASGPGGPLVLRQLTSPGAATPALRRALAACWVEVTNAGGAAGFPFPPIGQEQAAEAVDALAGSLAPETSRILLATTDADAAADGLVGWLHIRRDAFRLTAHWGTLHHVQTRPAVRGRGYGAVLMAEVRRVAREEMGLEQLHLAARGGAGLETFYARHGWRETGRRPGVLRFAPDGSDDRDEVLMHLDPL
ncbi:GNAT family N-acetyltransferase [Streptomyces sp. NPDC004111]|uniref:GNAT family N-acetyltransferase n=1 Tax=Streptomyces sp. NPDC004111 TaxID=3364690 RepID=UPI003698BCD3